VSDASHKKDQSIGIADDADDDMSDQHRPGKAVGGKRKKKFQKRSRPEHSKCRFVCTRHGCKAHYWINDKDMHYFEYESTDDEGCYTVDISKTYEHCKIWNRISAYKGIQTHMKQCLGKARPMFFGLDQDEGVKVKVVTWFCCCTSCPGHRSESKKLMAKRAIAFAIKVQKEDGETDIDANVESHGENGAEKNLKGNDNDDSENGSGDGSEYGSDDESDDGGNSENS
jgi:hypothetical protein